MSPDEPKLKSPSRARRHVALPVERSPHSVTHTPDDGFGGLHESVPPHDPGLEEFERFVATHGRQFDSYLATQPDRELFWSQGRRGVVSFVRRGRHVLVSGGLIAPLDERGPLLHEFLDYLATLRLRPMFFCIPEEDLPLFREVGFRITKIGEDAVVDLPDCTFSGKPFEWVRRQVNYCRRHGLVAEEVRPEDVTREQWQQILGETAELCRERLRERPQSKELEFFDGQLGEHRLGQRRLFVARSDEVRGRLEGFVVCNPLRGGEAWAIEIYRHRPDAVRGTLAFLFHHVISQLRDEGVSAVNLCIIPGHNCQTPLPDDNEFIRKGFARADRYFSLLFDITGIGHFKSRFRPRYEASYYCSPPDASFGAFWAIIMTLGVLRLDPVKTLRLAWRRLSIRRERMSLPRINPADQ